MSEINPVIPVEEYPLRWKRVQKLMKELDLDIVLAIHRLKHISILI